MEDRDAQGTGGISVSGQYMHFLEIDVLFAILS
jgi:hypothetical protein